MAKKKPAAEAHSFSPPLQDLLEFIKFLNIFRSIERVIWFKGVKGRERDGEHCFQLALVAWFLNERMKLGMDLLRLISIALVHDLVETYAGDTSCLPDLSGRITTGSRATKQEREEAALRRIEREWGSKIPSILEAIHEYEEQKTEVSCFLKALDKFVSVVNIYQDNGRTLKKLRTKFKAWDAYKRPNMGRHPVIKDLYEELRPILQASTYLYYTAV
ncbi:MAG TPA: HD domain-containing protein [Candidatus Paceibacterota bacterium]|nr:HD domain-containing protein [Candidatus Paceibacterota bacterium]